CKLRRIVERVVRTSRSACWSDTEARGSSGATRGPLVDDLGARSLLCVPLSARGRVLGALTIASERPSARYWVLDLALAEDLGRRVAAAVDNAELYEEAQRAVHVRDDLLAIVSHDLRTPLASIVASAALLLRSPGISEAGEHEQKRARTIQSSAARMA